MVRVSEELCQDRPEKNNAHLRFPRSRTACPRQPRGGSRAGDRATRVVGGPAARRLRAGRKAPRIIAAEPGTCGGGRSARGNLIPIGGGGHPRFFETGL